MARAALSRVRQFGRVGAAAVVGGAAALALYWVFLVPIFQAPDEAVHLDYALNLLQTGHLLSVRDRPLAPAAFDLVVHPDAVYLEAQSDFVHVRDTRGAMPASYGTCPYFRQLDAGAPPVDSAPEPLRSPSLITQYPFGYYAVLAAWLALAHAITTSLTLLFFSARLFSVLLLSISLTLSYGITRELRVPRPAALGLCALIGFFPMTTFVSSYVQPDNLTFALVSLSAYAALRGRRSQASGRWEIVLGLGAGLLLVTKWHVFVCVIPWMVAALLVRRRPYRGRLWVRALSLVGPSVILGLVQVWVAAGSTVRSYSPDGHGRGFFDPLLAAWSTGPATGLEHVGRALAAAYGDFYLGGPTFLGFWGRFGNDDTRLIIGSLRADAVVRATILILTTVIVGLTVVGRLRVARRLLTVARNRHPKVALELALADPLFNGYLTFTVFMFGLYAATDNFASAQGRNWLPFLLPIFLVPLRYAGQAFGDRRARHALTLILASLLAAFCLMGSIFGPRVVRDRYYQPVSASRPVVPVSCWPLPQLAGVSATTAPQS